MPAYTTADIRNVLIAGHGGSGKTTLVDALLFASGTVNRKASVAEGNSFSDFEKDPQLGNMSKLFTVDAIVNYVEGKLGQQQTA